MGGAPEGGKTKKGSKKSKAGKADDAAGKTTP